MTYNTLQVAEKLGISRSVVLRMVRDGRLKTINQPDPKKKKFFPRFDSKDISLYLQTNGKKDSKPRNVKNVTPVPNVLSRMANKLDELSQKIDALYNMWK